MSVVSRGKLLITVDRLKMIGSRTEDNLPYFSDGVGGVKKSPRVICHVFETDEAAFVAQSIGQAFQVRENFRVREFSCLRTARNF